MNKLVGLLRGRLAYKDPVLQRDAIRLEKALIDLQAAAKPMNTDNPRFPIKDAFYKTTNVVADVRREFDTTTITTEELAEVVATLLNDLKRLKMLP